MANLKELRVRIASVKSTQKITSAMKMVAAAKLRKAQQQAESARPYAQRMETLLQTLAANSRDSSEPLMSGTGKSDVHWLVIVSADRGLCGNFNGSVIRAARQHIIRAESAGKSVKLVFVGRKAYDVMKREFGSQTVKVFRDIAKPKLNFTAAHKVCDFVLGAFTKGEFDELSVLYNRFETAISQVPTVQPLIPLTTIAAEASDGERTPATSDSGALYLFEPSEKDILRTLLPKNLAMQLYKALLESAASEHGARMTAMDNATRNAGDMIKGLTLYYNRSRQAQITKELIEIISGAEAL